MKPCTDKCRDGADAKRRLFRKIGPFLAPYKINREKLTAAIEKAFRDTGEITETPEILPLIFGRVFDSENILWIDPNTPAGNIVTFDILATAYAMWRDAQLVAFGRGLDDVDAAEALTKVVHKIADRIVGGIASKIGNMRKYMFVCYVHAMTLTASKHGVVRSHSRRKRKDISDDGDFIESLDNVILCRELLGYMPDTSRRATILRYAFGCSCKETAEEIGISNSAARKAISFGLKKAFGVCMRELRALGGVNIEQAIKQRKRRAQRQAANER